MHYVYLITNLVNGKLYVGQTLLTPEQRLREHIYSKLKQDYFHAAIRKHGKDAFIVEELGRFETQEATNEAEKFWIERFNTCNRTLGYNTTYGGDYGGIPNEETRAKIGLASKGRTHSPETRQKMSEAHAGEKNHLFGLPPEQQPWFGKKLSEEHKKHCSEARKAWWERKRAEGYDFSAYGRKMSSSKSKPLDSFQEVPNA
jgi:group I intron endonuclease